MFLIPHTNCKWDIRVYGPHTPNLHFHHLEKQHHNATAVADLLMLGLFHYLLRKGTLR